MMISCISTHCSLTGDGAKTFLVLLSALLQGLEKLSKGELSFCRNIPEKEAQEEKCCGLKQISNFLRMIQTDIVDRIVRQDLNTQFSSVFSVHDTEVNRSAMERVLEAYFCGKVGNNMQKFLSRLSCDYYFSTTAGKSSSEVLCLVDECFVELHSTVEGLPVSSSRILDGLVLHREFAVYCPSDGDQRTLIITEPIQSLLSDLGEEVVVAADSQFWTSQVWITKRTETVINHMQQNNIKVLLSSVKQQETVHYCARKSGISVVECLSAEEISLICRITGIPPFRPSLDHIHSEITDVAVADFCKPLQFGARRYVHIGLRKTVAFQPHCVILCGPVKGVTEQHVRAFHGAFKMLRQMFTAVHPTEGCELRFQSQCLSKETEGLDKNEFLEFSTHLCTAVENSSSRNTPEQLQPRKDICTDHGISLTEKENTNKSNTSFIKSGSVVPVGGIFEILLHYYLSYYAKQCRSPNVSILCGLIADVLLSVPKTLLRMQKRNAFPQLYLSITNNLRNNQQLQSNESLLESVSCKYQLVVSVLQCAAALLSIDMIIGIKRLPPKAEESSSDEEL